MKRILPLILLTILNTTVYSQVFNLKGTVKTKEGPANGCSVINRTAKDTTSTNEYGVFTIPAKAGDIISFGFVGFATHEVKVKDDRDLNVVLESAGGLSEVIVTGYSVSIKNYWIGAKIGYNFTSNADDNFFVGSATIALNLLKTDNREHIFGVVGNIGNFKFNQDTTDSKNIQKLTQSINGLSIGLGYTHDKQNSSTVSAFRKFFQTGMRLTTFKNVGEDSATINFPQLATTAGIEFEKAGFTNGGSITASAGVSLFLFDKKLYKEIFNEKKSKLITFDCSVILPINKNMGFFANGTFSKKASAIYILGIIFKPTF